MMHQSEHKLHNTIRIWSNKVTFKLSVRTSTWLYLLGIGKTIILYTASKLNVLDVRHRISVPPVKNRGKVNEKNYLKFLQEFQIVLERNHHRRFLHQKLYCNKMVHRRAILKTFVRSSISSLQFGWRLL